MGYQSIVEILQTFHELIHNVLRFALTQLRIYMTNDIREEVAACTELQKNMPVKDISTSDCRLCRTEFNAQKATIIMCCPNSVDIWLMVGGEFG